MNEVLKINNKLETVNINNYENATVMLDIKPSDKKPMAIINTSEKFSRITLHLFVNNLHEIKEFFNSDFNLCQLAETWRLDINNE